MSRKIMVVEDDSALRMTFQELLIDEGWDVVSAEDGYQAINLASDGQIALVLMDIMMPGMNGVEAFMAIKKILPDCVVVMMTGFAEVHLLKKALSEGAMTILRKPVEIENLLGLIDTAIPESVSS